VGPAVLVSSPSLLTEATSDYYACRSLWYLQQHGVPFSSIAFKFGNYPAALTNDLLYEAQTVNFFTLVVMQWGCVLVFS